MDTRLNRPNAFQAQWDSLPIEWGPFDKALVLLCDYAGISLREGLVKIDDPTRVLPTYKDRNQSEAVKRDLHNLFSMYGNNDFLQKKGDILYCSRINCPVKKNTRIS